MFKDAVKRMKRNTMLIGTLGCLLAALAMSAESGFYLPFTPASAEAAESAGGGGAGGSGQSVSEIGEKLANPTSDVWAMFTEFDFSFSDGDLNTGSELFGFRMIFQPVLPWPLYGKGKHGWKLITRPTLPILFSEPVPTGFNESVHLGGLGDMQLPMIVAPPTGKIIFGLGPTWLFPTATRDEFGHQQWGVGPAVVLGYATKEWIAGAFPQYTLGIGGWNDGPDASYMSILYWFIYHLEGGWDVGISPTISYDERQSPGNQWNVPVGLYTSKMTKMGNTPVKLQVGVEYSVVSPDEFGQRCLIKFNVIPVIPGLVQTPIFGGD